MLGSLAGSLKAWSPGTSDPLAVQNFTVNTNNRTDVLAFYNTVYTASETYPTDMLWSGQINASKTGDVAGTTSATFKSDVQRRINFYRALVALPAVITFVTANNDTDQLAALMFSANDRISHTPKTTDVPAWTDFTTGGATAAGHSNIAVGYYGPGAIDGYMVDNGDAAHPNDNNEVGHRRWLLYTIATQMGTGDIPFNGTPNAANAVWFDGTTGTEPATFIPWPNAGYCPFSLTPARWSVSVPHGDFTIATVTMSQGATPIQCSIIYRDSDQTNGNTFTGDNTIAWEPSGLPTALAGDTTYTVTVSGIANDTSGHNGTITYNVTLFDPNVLGQTTTIAGPTAPSTTGATYSFNRIDEADTYNLQVSTGSTAAWDEGAEDTPTPQAVPSTTGSYPLRQSAVVHTGSKAFQLAFPSDVDGSNQAQSYDFTDQSFEVTRQIIPTSSSQLQFYDLCRFVINTSTLSAQVSSDNGNSWTSIWSRAGVVLSGGTSSDWDPSFILNNVSLAGYAGQVILIRFVLSGNNQTVYLGTTSSYGFFLDDITITNATQLINSTVTQLPGSTTSFSLNSTTAGGALQAGTSYYLRISPEVGTKWFPFGPYDLVTVQNSAATGYSSWISSQYPSVTGGPTGDYSGDGISNGLKYAFGLDPTIHNALSSVPHPTYSGSSLTLSYTAGAGGVTYGAQSSTDLVTWTPITDTGSGSNHIFTVSTTSQRKIFIRNHITIAP
jgi:hypothetical protein